MVWGVYALKIHFGDREPSQSSTPIKRQSIIPTPKQLLFLGMCVGWPARFVNIISGNIFENWQQEENNNCQLL